MNKPHLRKVVALRFLHYSRLVIKIFLVIGIALLSWEGAIGYVKNFLKKWSEENQVEVQAERWSIQWDIPKPRLIFKNVAVKNKIPWDSFQKLFIKEVALDFKPFTMFKSGFKVYEIFVECKEVKLEEKSKSYARTKQCSFFFIGNYPLYKIKRIETETVNVALTQEYTTIPDNPNNQPFFAHLFLYFILGELEYHALQQILKLELRIPRAVNQMPKNATYDVHINGYLHFLDMPFPLPPRKTPIPLKGLIKITINNFSHFLGHLYQARVISSLVDNLGSIVGYPVSKEDIQLGKKEIFTNAVTLNLNVHPDAIDIGGFKIYP